MSNLKKAVLCRIKKPFPRLSSTYVIALISVFALSAQAALPFIHSEFSHSHCTHVGGQDAHNHHSDSEHSCEASTQNVILPPSSSEGDLHSDCTLCSFLRSHTTQFAPYHFPSGNSYSHSTECRLIEPQLACVLNKIDLNLSAPRGPPASIV